MSSRDVSSCDVRRAVGTWEAIYHWILWRRFTLLSLCLRHVISRASTPLTFLLSHTFREVSSRDVRIVCTHLKTACLGHVFQTESISLWQVTDTGWRSALPFLTRLLGASLGQLCWRGEEMRPTVYLWCGIPPRGRHAHFYIALAASQFFLCPDSLLSRIVTELSHISNAGYESGPTDIYRSLDTGFTVC